MRQTSEEALRAEQALLLLADQAEEGADFTMGDTAMPATDDLEEARQFAKEGKYEAALGIFRAAGGTEGYYGAAACLYRLARYAEAEEELSHCFELDPQHEKGQSLVGRIRAERQRAESATETAEARKKAKLTRNIVIGCLACLMLFIILIGVFLISIW